jgi:hypothetical protein
MVKLIGKYDAKRIATIVAIVLLLALGFALWRAGEDNIPPPSSVQTMKNGEAEGRRQQFASWTFTYDKATTLGDQVTQQIEGIHDGVFYKDGKALVRMRADRVLYNSATHDFSVSGPAHFDVDDHGVIRTFDANSATWTDAQQTMRIPGPATIGSRRGGRLIVEDVTVDLRSGQYTIGKIEGSAVP